MLELTIANGPEQGRTILIDKQAVQFGRLQTNHVALYWDGMVSGVHFRIEPEQQDYVLLDTGSRNGTKVNGQRVVRHLLCDKDHIEVGTTILIVRNQAQIVSNIVEDSSWSRKSWRRNSPFDDSAGQSSKQSGSSPIEGSFSDFQPVRLDESAEKDRGSKSSWYRDDQSFESKVQPPVSSRPAPVPIPPSSEATPTEEMARPEFSQTGAVHADLIRQVRLRLREGQTDNQQTLHWIGPDESLTVGSSPSCDCCLVGDGRIAPKHFEVRCTERDCTITDLRSNDGTWVNGNRVHSATLFNGDVAWAGACVFTVEIETLNGFLDRSGNTPAVVPVAAPVDVAPRSEVQMPTGKLPPVSVTEEELAHAVYVLKGIYADTLSPHLLIDKLADLGNLFLLLDCSKVQLPYPPGVVAQESSIFGWMPPDAARLTPNLFANAELPDPSAVVDEALGSDALVILLSDLQKKPLLEQIRGLIQDADNKDKLNSRIVGLCWPSVLNAILIHDVHKISERLFACVNCILVEGDAPDSWRLIVRNRTVGDKLRQRWAESGLILKVEK